MKKNIFLIVFVIFASIVFYKFGPKNTSPQQKETRPQTTATAIPTSAPTTKNNNDKDLTKVQKSTSQPKKLITKKPKPLSLFPKLQSVDLSNLKEPIKHYNELKNEVLASIPLKGELKKEAKNNPHGPSFKLIQAGKKLGSLKSFILKYPNDQNIQKEAEDFYEQCASYSSYPNSVRSLCLYNRTILSKNKGEKFDTDPYPEEIKKVVLKQGM